MNGLLRNVCLIERLDAETVSGTGEPTTVWAIVDSNVPCRIEPRSGDYRQKEYGQQQQVTHLGFFGSLTDVHVGDHVILGDTRFLVTFIAERAGMGRVSHFEADLSLVIAP
jgi:hypothetical protein